MLRLVLISILAVSMTACPTTNDTRTVVDECTKTGTQCRMGGGKLGVCMMKADGAFECASQH